MSHQKHTPNMLVRRLQKSGLAEVCWLATTWQGPLSGQARNQPLTLLATYPVAVKRSNIAQISSADIDGGIVVRQWRRKGTDFAL